MDVDRRTLLTAGGAGLAAVALGSTAAAATTNDPATAPPGDVPVRGRGRPPVVTGAEASARRGWSDLSGYRVGVISNPTGILSSGAHIVDDMWASGNVTIAGVFGPEHGFRGSAQAGEAEPVTIDPRTGVTVYDAYGARLAKFKQMMQDADVEVVVFDIQDVGARFYTYIWTMWSAMGAAAQLGLRFVVLDRPNPNGGAARGPMLFPGYESGVGQRYITLQHGMTVGELARFFDEQFLPDDAGATLGDLLEVVELEGWDPGARWENTGLPWVPPSPNMPTPDTAINYPGTCLFEGTAASEGRGTTRPFELVGAPYIGYHWTDDLNAAGLPGVTFREAYFVPTFSKHAGKTCGGTQPLVTSPTEYDALRTGITMITLLKARYPEFQWRGGGTSDGFINLLFGSDRFRVMVDAGASADDIVAVYQDELADFDNLRQQYLLYRRPR